MRMCWHVWNAPLNIGGGAWQVGGGSVEGGLAAVHANDQAMRELVSVLDVDAKVRLCSCPEIPKPLDPTGTRWPLGGGYLLLGC